MVDPVSIASLRRLPSIVDVHAASLRAHGYSSLKAWLAVPGHLYLGRESAYVEGATQSKWANPYAVNTHGLKRSLELFEQHLFDSGLIHDIEELKGTASLGCWCITIEKWDAKRVPKCHVEVIMKYLFELVHEQRP